MIDKKYLNIIKDQYLKPTADRIVDQKMLALTCEHVISQLPAGGGRLLELGVGDQVWTPRLLAKYWPNMRT